MVPNTLAHYTPFGDWRTEPTQTMTDRGFTGHRSNNKGAGDMGLIYMNARYYLPGVGRFVSADSLVPDPANPQSFNRYSYVLNSPLNFTDPSGHNPICSQDGLICSDGAYDDSLPLVYFTVTDGVDETWTIEEKWTIIEATMRIDTMFRERGSSFRQVYGGAVTFEKIGQSCQQATGFDCYAKT